MTEPAPKTSFQADRRMALARQWDDLVAHIRRTVPGQEDFLKPPPLEKLLPAARHGPIVVINVSSWRRDALIVTTRGIHVEPLPKLTISALREITSEYLQVLHAFEAAVRELFLARKLFDDGDRSPGAIRRYTAAKFAFAAVRTELETGLAYVAEWLWDCIAEPVLSALGFMGEPPNEAPLPRLWWCPTGLLNLLPLHAAGYHSAPGNSPRTVIDRVVSSYTPTVRALLNASQSTRDAIVPRMLIVAAAAVYGEVPLSAVSRERDLLKRLFTDRHTLLENETATWESVRRDLPRHGWVHFSCHADQSLADPSRGGFLLHDKILTVTDISAAEYRGEFAFLSACKTAIGGVALADEVITLAAALHYTGYKHVIGTLWSVYDNSAADVAEAVYTQLMSDGEFAPDRSAYALHTAVKRIRDRDRTCLSTWMPFAHIGP